MRGSWIVLAMCSSVGAAQAASSVKLSVEMDPQDPQSALFSVTQDKAYNLYLACEEKEDDLSVGTPDRIIVSAQPVASQTLTVRGLKASTRYKCKIDGDKNSNTVNLETDPLPDDLAAPDIALWSADPASTGYTLVNTGDLTYDATTRTYPNARNYLVILDAEGNIRWYYQGPGSGDIDASYLAGEGILFTGQHDVVGKPNAFYAPTVVGLNKQILYPLAPLPVTASPVPGVTDLAGSYNHDVGVSLDGQGIYTLSYTTRTNTSGVAQQGFVIREINRNTNAVMWSWDSFAAVANGQLPAANPLAPTATTQGIPAYSGDPWHPNTVWESVEGGVHFLYVNLRNLSMVFKINRDNNGLSLPTTFKQSPVVWRMGAFARVPTCTPGTAGCNPNTWPYEFTLRDSAGNALPPSQWFFDQHDIKVTVDANGNKFMTVYDNGADRVVLGGTSYSRLMKIRFTETSPKNAYLTYEYKELDANSVTQWAEPFWGGYDELANGNILAAQGHCSFCTLPAGQGGTGSPASHNSTLLELNPATNSPVWKAVFPDASTMIYRAEHIDGCAIFNQVTYCPSLEQLED